MSRRRYGAPEGSRTRLLTSAQIAHEYGLRPSTTRDLIHKGHLPAVQFLGGRVFYVERDRLEALIAANRVQR